MPDPFISRDDLTDYLGRDVSADAGALIAVDAACDIVRTVAEQSFNADTSTITLDGTGTDALLLPELPVSNAGTVVIGGTASGTAVTDYALASNGVLIRKIPDTTVVDWYAYQQLPTIVWPAGRQNVTVTYDHGYADADLPRDVRMVALSLASRLIVQGVAVSERVGDNQMTYAGPAMDLTSTEKAVLRKYRR